MEQFRLRITMGNDAMSTPMDIAAALREVADEVEEGTLTGTIRDANGNTVGEWNLSG